MPPMSIVDGTGLIEWEGMLFEPGSDLLARTRWVFNYVRERGATIVGNEAGRPFGVYSDRNVRNASDTASGRSTVHYQWGRYLRGETPSAADPAGGIYASDHTKGLATDTNCSDIAIRREGMRLVGMVQTIPSESWHFAIRSAPLVDLTGWNTTGENQGVDDMYGQAERDELIGRIDQRVVGKLDQLLNRGPVFQRFRNSNSGEMALAGWGVWWPIPNIAYNNLLVARGMTTSGVIDVPSNEYDFFKNLYLLSESNDKEILAALSKLSAEEAQRAADAAKAAAK